MQTIGVRGNVDQRTIYSVLKKHISNPTIDIKVLAESIANGTSVNLDYDWVLEQDLKDIGVIVK